MAGIPTRRCEPAEDVRLAVAQEHVTRGVAEKRGHFTKRREHMGEIVRENDRRKARRAHGVEECRGAPILGKAGKCRVDVFRHRFGQPEHLPLRAAKMPT